MICEVAGEFGREVSTRSHPEPSKLITKGRYNCVKTDDREKRVKILNLETHEHRASTVLKVFRHLWFYHSDVIIFYVYWTVNHCDN